MSEQSRPEHLLRESDAAPPVVPTAVLPTDFLCPGCDYDLGGSESKVCPECGRVVVPIDLERFVRRGAAASSLRPLVRRTLWSAAGVVALMSFGAMLLAINAGAVPAAILALVLCGIAAAGSISSGWVAAMAAPKRDRAIIRAAWLRALPWLNGSWLLVPTFAIAGAVFAVMGLVSTAAADLPTLTDPGVILWLVGGLAWLCGSIIAVVVGARRLRREVVEHGVYPRKWWVWMLMAMTVVIIGALLLGLVGMIFATGGAIRLAAALGY